MNESRLGVAATGAGVCVNGAGVVGTEGPLGKRLKSSLENWDWMSTNDVEGSMEVKESQSAGDSTVPSGENDAFCGVG